jgi:hypothetical protein
MTMPHELRRIVPLPQPEMEAIFAAYHATSQFYREVQTRETMSLYCDWYYRTAALHRQELQQMRGELNILSWFRRGKQ